ncbi:MAG: hypothetical protein MRY64_15400 [Hyphomonadaceae bacterium]|nr:hypothetical protein [Hyphomonadaceae bacterium]
MFGLGKSASEYLRDAEAALARKRYTEANAAADKVLEKASGREPGDARLRKHAFRICGRCATQSGHKESAASYYLSASESDDREGLLAVAEGLRVNAPHLNGAIDYCLDGLAVLAPGAPELILEVSGVLQTRLKPKTSLPAKFSEWRKWNERLAAIVGAPPWARFHLAMMDACEGRYANAAKELESLPGSHEGSVELNRLRALVYAHLDRPDDAIAALSLVPDAERRSGDRLLEAHVDFQLGQYRQTRSIYAHLSDSGLELPHASKLDWAEACLHLGDALTARGLLADLVVSESDDRRVWLEARADAALGDIEAAIERYRNLLETPYADVAAEAVIMLGLQYADRDGIDLALSDVPEARRDARWHIASSLAAASRGLVNQALGQSLTGEDAERIKADISARDRFNKLVQLADNDETGSALLGLAGLPVECLPAAAVTQLAEALGAQLLVQVAGDSAQDGLAELGLSALKTVRKRHPSLNPDQTRQLDRMIATIAYIAGKYVVASNVSSAAGVSPRTGLLAAVKLGNPALVSSFAAQAGLSSLERDEAVAAAQAVQGDLVEAAAKAPEGSELHALITYVQTGATPPLSEGGMGYPSVMCAMAAAHMSDPAAARAALKRVPETHPAASRAEEIALVLDYLEGDYTAVAARAATSRVDAAVLFTGLPMAAEALGNLAGLAASLGHAPLLEEALSSDMVYDARQSHALAVFHLVRGANAARAYKLDAAREHWTQAVGFFAVACSDTAYLVDWLAVRPYDDLDPEGLIEGLERHMKSLMAPWTSVAASAGGTETSEALGRLPVLFQAELEAARLVAQYGGLGGGDDATASVCAGPRAVRTLGLLPAFRALHQRIEQNYGDARLETLEILFSSLGVPKALLETGQTDAALSLLRAGVADVESGKAYEQDWKVENPAFYAPGSEARFVERAKKLMLDTLVSLSETALSHSQPSADRIRQHIESAIELAEALGQGELVAERLGDKAMRRAVDLQRASKFEAALNILDAVSSVIKDEELLENLANAIAQDGVRIANDSQDYEGSVRLLRKAKSIYPHSLYVRQNLIFALHACTQSLASKRPAEALEMMEEGVRLGREWLVQDPYNDEIRDIVGRLNNQSSLLRSMVPGTPSPAQPAPAPEPRPAPKAEPGGKDASKSSLDDLLKSVRSRPSQPGEDG